MFGQSEVVASVKERDACVFSLGVVKRRADGVSIGRTAERRKEGRGTVPLQAKKSQELSASEVRVHISSGTRERRCGVVDSVKARGWFLRKKHNDSRSPNCFSV